MLLPVHTVCKFCHLSSALERSGSWSEVGVSQDIIEVLFEWSLFLELCVFVLWEEHLVKTQHRGKHQEVKKAEERTVG